MATGYVRCGRGRERPKWRGMASTSADHRHPAEVGRGSDITDYGFGLAAMVDVPGADPIMVYEPRHPEAYDL
jgi:hypothetical protein